MTEPSPADDGQVVGDGAARFLGGRSRKKSTPLRRLLLLGLKIGLSALLIYRVIQGIDASEIIETVHQARWLLLGAAFALFYVGYALSIVRWKLLLEAQGIVAPGGFLLRSYMTAIVFSNVLPSTIGGDAVRAYDSWRLGAGRAQALATILLDRVLGLTGLLFVAAIGLVVSRDLSGRYPTLRPLFLGGLLAAGVGVWSLVKLGRSLSRTSLPRPLGRLLKMLGRVRELVYVLYTQPGVVAKCLVLSIVLQLNGVLFGVLVGAALRLPIPAFEFFAIMPLATLTLMLPVTINGIGIRENVYVLLLGTLGVGATAALGFAWTGYGLQLLQVLPCLVVYFLRR